ncbi:MAG: Coenzyme F420 hydrogenase/dehydrogenase, beta subunit C-terminal domain, partial [bacterium]
MTNSLNRLRRIVSDNLCHRCGSCSGICPKNVLRPDDEYYPNWEGRESDCTDCGLCVKVCSGTGFSFPEYSRRMFGREETVADKHGLYIKAFLSHTTDPELRSNSTSGGLGTELPRYLLRSGRAKGAFSVGFDKDHPWKPAAFIARGEDELRMGSYSKYPVCAINHLFGEIRDDQGPFVYTGLPCHLHGLIKMSELDRKIGEKIALTVGLYCHSCLEHQALMDMMSIYGISETEVTGMNYRSGKLPGYVRAQTKDGAGVTIPYPSTHPDGYRPNAKEVLTLFFKLYSPKRCRLCVDAMADFADIAIGDPWIRGWEAVDKLRLGYNLVIA